MASQVKVSKLNFELNPRGNLWFNDETTFGHKLLSKMGWSKGKGLGKNEDGIKENIKISKRDTNTGVGWKNDEIPVTVGCLEYENILQNLQKHFKNDQEKFKSNESFEKSLEQRSRKAKNHLHYQKFVRVKDLNRYSEKDMKSIFLEKPPKPVREHPSSHANQTFNSQLSVNDYFAMKIQRKKEDTSISNENSLTPKSQPINENFSKKRKFISESPENETSRKTKLKKKNSDDETSFTKNNLPTDKSSDFKEIETSRKAKLKKNSGYEISNTKNNLPTDKNSESIEIETLRTAKLKKNSNGETSNTKNNLHTDESSESKECGERKKKFKKMKKNKLHLQQLKSCLKGRTEYNLEKSRNVSFNEQVSYKILDTSLELCEDINDVDSDDPTMEETTFGGESMEESGDEEPPTIIDSVEEPENNILNENDNENTKDEEADSINEEEGISNEQSPQCLDLPKCSGSKFNFWLENQRQASKMKLYKEMMKKIRKNKTLCSTNLLDIKGYGNWGL
uniref:PIN2/TERF1-interacting telomerase inhibitor 1 n=1 Tax=Parasteatoda tepidariorum TaxID=114398 RepID=A0A2L2Y166_PARTP